MTEDIMEKLQSAIEQTIDGYINAKSVDERVAHSEAFKNLTTGLGALIGTMRDFADIGMMDEEDLFGSEEDAET